MKNKKQLNNNYNKYVKEYVKDKGVAKTPIPYRQYKDKLKRYMDKKEPILVEDNSFPNTSSIKMYINHVSDRWVGGYSEVLYEGRMVRVPYTLHYSDLYISNPNYKKKIRFINENPYESGGKS